MVRTKSTCQRSWPSPPLAQHLDAQAVVVVSSQVPVGTCERLDQLIRDSRPSLPGVGYVPENLQLGQALVRFLHPEFLVIGSEDESVRRQLDGLFAPMEVPRVLTNLRTAEFIKHALNAYLATSISFINEMANLCDLVGADGLTVANALKLDSRVSPRAPLTPGLGFSGVTLARDMKVLSRLSKEHGYEAPLVESVLRVNKHQNQMVTTKLRRIYGPLEGIIITVLGLTYKAGTSTLRRSVTVEVIRELIAGGASVRAFDPGVDRSEVPTEVSFCDDPYAAATGSHALVIMTPWPEFQSLDFERLHTLMKTPVLLDAQNALDRDRMLSIGFRYLSVGTAAR